MAGFHRSSVAALLAFLTTVHIQDSFYWQALPVSGSSSENYTDAQCAAPFTEANATGILPLNKPEYGLLSNNFSWTIAVSQPAGDTVRTTNMSLYFGTPAGQDLRLGTLSYSACAILFEGLSDNLIRRGQIDEGSCMQTFSEECVKALADQASITGFYLTNGFTSNYPNPGNLSAGSLPRVCGDIEDALNAMGAVPEECAQFVGPSMTWNDGTDSNITLSSIDLTGPNATIDKSCTYNTTVNPSNSNTLIPSTNMSLLLEWSMLSGPNNMTALYDNATQSVLPILTVTFPPANDTRQSWVNYGQGYMTCLRANIARAGSRTAALPAPTALRHIRHALTKGDKAGIAISYVVIAAILIGLGFWWWLKKKREKKERKAVREMEKRKLELEKERREEQDREEVINPMKNSVQRYEIMTDVGGRAELDPGIVNELEGSGVPELED